MDCRESLKLAADAFGHPYEVDGRGRVFLLHYGNAGRYEWTPYNNYSDALRLGLKLGMTLNLNGDKPTLFVPGYTVTGKDALLYLKSGETDAVCLAIVRAAAQIGQQTN